MKKELFLCLAVLIAGSGRAQQVAGGRPEGTVTRPDGLVLTTAAIDSTVRRLMDAAEVTGLCIGIVQDGQVRYIKAYGYKNKPMGQWNDTATCFYGASLSKAVFARLVMQLVDEGRIDLDKPLYRYLPKPLPEYDKYKDLAGDDRWRLITARMCLDHTTGFPNWRQFNPRDNNKLEIFFTPGQRYAYSGEGLYLLQMVVESITGRPLEDLARERIFQPFGMRRTSYLWQPAFGTDYAVGHNMNQDTLPKRRRSTANAAGSMETTIADYTRFMAAVIRGDGLSAKARQTMLTPQIAIYSLRQFPSLDSTRTDDNKSIQLSYGQGWGLFNGAYGRAFFKEGHDDGWQHYCIGFPDKGVGLVLMANSDFAESIYKELVEWLTGVTMPWYWEGYTPYRPVVRLADTALQGIAGKYEEYDHVKAIITLVNGQLKVESETFKLPPTNLYAANDHQFFMKAMDVQIEFFRGPDGKIKKAEVNDEGDRYELTRVKEFHPSFHPQAVNRQTEIAVSKDTLRSYEGIYQANADHRITVSYRKGRLYAEGSNPLDQLPRIELHPFSESEFYIAEAPLKFRFQRDDSGQVLKMMTYGSTAPMVEWERVK